jgi:methyl-accepting chemotaxis protein
MDALTVLLAVLYLVLIVLAATAVWGLREMVGTARSVRRLSDELDKTLPPLIERASDTLGAVDLELGRINGVVSQIEEVSDRVSNTARSAQEMVGAPAAAVSGLAEGARRFMSVLFRG